MTRWQDLAYVVLLLFLYTASWAEPDWYGSVRSGYQSYSQLFNPTEVKPWLSDAVSSATRQLNEKGPVTEVESCWDFQWPQAAITAGFFARAWWLADATWSNILAPVFTGYYNHHSWQVGRFTNNVWGTGLLQSAFPLTGLNYAYRSPVGMTSIFYQAWLERTCFKKTDIDYMGVSQTFPLTRGQAGILYTYDQSAPFADPARARVNPGSGLSIAVDWEFENYWYIQGEFVYANTLAFFAGLDLPLLANVSLQTRIRHQGQGFNPRLSQFSREGTKQTQYLIRLPLEFISEEWVLSPQWGIKHEPEGDFWLPGVSLEATLGNAIWFQGRIYAEQPCEAWGSYRHYEFTEAEVIWMLNAHWYLELRWLKAFNGFLDWKETENQMLLEYRW